MAASRKCRGSQLENSDPLGVRTHLHSLATWMQKLKSFFGALRLDKMPLQAGPGERDGYTYQAMPTVGQSDSDQCRDKAEDAN